MKKRKKGEFRKKPREGSAFLWVVGAVLLVMFYIYWQNTGVVNKAEVLKKSPAPAVQKTQIKDKNISRQKVEKRNIENKVYVHEDKVLKEPKTPASSASADVKRYKNPRIAIVLDDFGYNMRHLSLLSEIKEPITLSILPELKYSGSIASQARANGYEVILHLPLESERTDVQEEADTIRTGMGDRVIRSRLERELKTVPGADGVSNHMGSKSTSERDTMTSIFGYLKKNDLYFFDSMTSAKSICRDVAGEVGIPYARRDIFIDNSNNLDDIERELQATKRIAFKKGFAIAIGHDRKNTIIALRRIIPQLKKEGVVIVGLSEVVK